MDTSGLRVTLMAEHKAAAGAKDTITKNKATKKIAILDMAANNSAKPRKAMLNALSDDGGWEKVPSIPESASSTKSETKVGEVMSQGVLRQRVSQVAYIWCNRS